ncbi:MAG: protoporphyrinogen oxidase [Chloroflexia bacterium]|nr:protoporphyrinogen oxidase [Chloroflexia bacterium]
MTASPPRQIAVIGGGITGLAAAYRLTRLAPEATIVVIEREGRPGGKIQTERVDGFIIDAGPDSFLSIKPRGIGLCQELGIAGHLTGPDPAHRRTYVLTGGKLHRLPEGLTGLIPTRLGPIARTRLISPRGKARMALDFVLPPRRDERDESLAAFVERRLGREAYARLIEPLMAGIYAGDGHQLSLAATFPQLRAGELTHGGLIKGVLAGRKLTAPLAPDAPRPGFLSLPGGLGNLVDTLEAHLRAAGVRFLLGAEVTALRARAAGGFHIVTAADPDLTADSAIVTTPAWEAAALLQALDPALATTLAAIPHVSTATVSLAYPQCALARPLDGYGYVVPRAEGRAVLAMTWVSTKWPGRAPEGFALLRGFIGRAGQPDPLERSDTELVDLLRAEARDVLGITAPPAARWVFRWPAGMPQYTLGHLERIAAIERAVAEHSGLAIAGAALRGVGIPDCIASGEAAAHRVASWMGPADPRTG